MSTWRPFSLRGENRERIYGTVASGGHAMGRVDRSRRAPRPFLLLLLVSAIAVPTAAADEDGDAADSVRTSEASAPGSLGSPPPPAGIRYGEPLPGDRIRIGYSWQYVKSQGLMAGDDDITPDYARDTLGFATTPRSLRVTLHTFQVAYAPHPRVTLLVDVPFVEKELERIDPARGRRVERTDGVGDLAFAVVIPFIRKGFESSHVHLGFDAPTGSIRRSSLGARLPYDSQIGNGTWDLEWGWTYRGELERFGWGGQAFGRHPMRRNGLRYREGSRFTGSIWGSVRLFAGLTASLRAEWEKQNNISGFDRGLDARSDPAENDKLRGGTRFSLAPGVSLDLPQLNDQRIAFEFSIPVHQDLDGPQLERDWTLKTAWQWVF